MDLAEVLEKNKNKSKKASAHRIPPPSIATEDRPYDLNKNDDISTKLLPAEYKTGNKVAIKWQQSGNKPTTKVATKWQQSGNKNTSKGEKWQQSGNKVATEPTTELTTKWQQSGNKVATINSKLFSFSCLVGLQKALAIFLYQECKKARSKITESLSLEYISNNVKASTGAIKTTLQRLELKEIIIRNEFKNGRSGWTKYGLHDNVFQDLLHLESTNSFTLQPTTKWQQSGNKVATEPTTEPTTTPSSSSSSNLDTTTTKEVDQNFSLPEEWDGIDIEPLYSIKFTKEHLAQLFKIGKLTSEMVQNSINAFAFDVEYNNKSDKLKHSPLNFFMGILRKGEPYLPPENYESPQDKVMRLYVQKQRELEARRQKQEEEALKFAFEDWKLGLNDAQIAEICPYQDAKDEKSPIRNGYLRLHFVENLWPEIKKSKILENSYVNVSSS